MQSFLPAALVCVLVTLAATLIPRDGAAQAQKARVQWEYKAVSLNELFGLAPKDSKDKRSDGLNKLGEKGWELVAVEPPPPPSQFGLPGPSTYVFKRTKGQ
jgi:hypothetical protein